MSTGKLKHTLKASLDVDIVAFSPDGQTLATNGDGIHLWDVSTGKLKHFPTVDTALSVAFSPDWQMLASGHLDGSIRLWKLSDTCVGITPDPVMSPAIGEQFTISVDIVEGENIGGYQVGLEFDPTALRYVTSANGDYLPSGAFFVPPVVSENAVTLGATALTGVSNGDGTLATVTFEVVDVKKSAIAISETILTDSEGEHLPYLSSSANVVEPSLLTSSAVVRLTPASVLSPAVGDRFTFNVDITGGQNIADFQLTFDYDGSALRLVSKRRGNYLADGVGNGDGTLETVTFKVRDVKTSKVNISGYLIAPNGLRSVPTFESAKVIVPLLGDVNRDGVVNILDLVQVASSFGQPVPEEGNPADVNEDGVVNVEDLVKVAGALGKGAAAPSLDTQAFAMFTAADVQKSGSPKHSI